MMRPAQFTFKLPDNVSFAEGAMVELFAVGLHGKALLGNELATAWLNFDCTAVGSATEELSRERAVRVLPPEGKCGDALERTHLPWKGDRGGRRRSRPRAPRRESLVRGAYPSHRFCPQA
jgi:hypothetical protein